MNRVPKSKSYPATVVLWIGLVFAIPLWREFHEPAALGWNIFLAAFLIAVVLAAFFGIRHLQKSGIDVGEARFKTNEAGPK